MGKYYEVVQCRFGGDMVKYKVIEFNKQGAHIPDSIKTVNQKDLEKLTYKSKDRMFVRMLRRQDDLKTIIVGDPNAVNSDPPSTKTVNESEIRRRLGLHPDSQVADFGLMFSLIVLILFLVLRFVSLNRSSANAHSKNFQDEHR